MTQNSGNIVGRSWDIIIIIFIYAPLYTDLENWSCKNIQDFKLHPLGLDGTKPNSQSRINITFCRMYSNIGTVWCGVCRGEKRTNFVDVFLFITLEHSFRALKVSSMSIEFTIHPSGAPIISPARKLGREKGAIL